jgi:alpha-mannosidase
MVLVPHQDSLEKSHIPRMTEEFISPAATIYQGIHGGSIPKYGSFLSVDVQNVVVTSIKQSEEGEDLIIRCVETSGLQTDAILDLRFNKQQWKGSFSPFEIKSLRVNKKSGVVKEVNLLEE